MSLPHILRQHRRAVERQVERVLAVALDPVAPADEQRRAMLDRGEAMPGMPTDDPVAFAILFAVSSILGAAIYGLLSWQNTALVGAYPGVYGLIGAYTYLMWLALNRMGENQLKAFQLIGILLGLMLVYSMIFGSAPTWIASSTPSGASPTCTSTRTSGRWSSTWTNSPIGTGSSTWPPAPRS